MTTERLRDVVLVTAGILDRLNDQEGKKGAWLTPRGTAAFYGLMFSEFKPTKKEVRAALHILTNKGN
jgi:hypothetical protein